MDTRSKGLRRIGFWVCGGAVYLRRESNLFRRSRVGVIAVAVLALLSVTTTQNIFAQNQEPYSISAENQVITNLPTTTFGGGGIYNVTGGTNGYLDQLSWNMSFPMGNVAEVTAFDPCTNGLLTVSASANVYSQSVSNGVLSEWIAGTSATPNANCVGVDSVATAYSLWLDKIYVSGLRSGKAVTLLVTFDVSGYLSFEGTYNPNTDQVDCQTQQDLGNLEESINYDKKGPVSSHHVFRLHTTSGATLDLANSITGYLSGTSGETNPSNSEFSINKAAIYVDPVTPGAIVTSASGVNYATPSQLIAVPSIALESQSTAVSNLAAAGLTIGTITTASSKTVPAGSVINQVPAGGTEVPSLFPVSLLVSSGLPAAACAGDASSLVSFTQSAITYDSATKLYDQTVTVTNISSAAIKGPISLLVEDLSAGATLVNAKGATTCDDPGTPYVAKGSPLAAGQTDTFVLHFADPSQQGITWTAGVTAEGSP